MSVYKIIEGLNSVKYVFERLRTNKLVTRSYFEETISRVHRGDSGIVYDIDKKMITTFCRKRSKLLKIFNELINEGQIKLEEIK